ncbi:MAG TPA: exodeoxyribonuclease VII small subunit [Candidatus Saccharimonadales bacterium]|nr:exodeoxyribonuclease VII small subunit [Candidatus Saccharimonadales bacterium]
MAKKLSYDQLNLELEELITKLQDPNIGVDNALVLYKRGREIIKDLKEYLKTVKNTVEKINSDKNIE